MDLEGILLTEIIWTEEDKYCMISLMWDNLKKKKLIVKEIRFVVTRSGGRGSLMRIVKRYKLTVINKYDEMNNSYFEGRQEKYKHNFFSAHLGLLPPL